MERRNGRESELDNARNGMDTDGKAAAIPNAVVDQTNVLGGVIDSQPKPMRQEYDFAEMVNAIQSRRSRQEAQALSGDKLDSKCHKDLDEYLKLFFGTTELTQKEDAIQPKAGAWRACVVDRTCTGMSSVSIPKGSSRDQKEAELDLFYSILYAILTHLLSAHFDEKRLIRAIKFKMTEICVKRNERQMYLRREVDRGAKEEQGQ